MRNTNLQEKVLKMLVFKKIAFIFVILGIFLLFPSVLAQMTSDVVGVNVSVNATAQIVVTPINLTWVDLNPGNDGGIKEFTIKNTGSYNVSQIYVSVDTSSVESTNPLPTGDPAKYAASGFLYIQNWTTSTQYYHVGRLEWNISEVLAGETFPGDLHEVWGHGWYRNRTEQYLWLIENGTDGYCNSTDARFTIITEPENATHENRDLSGTKTTNCGSITTGEFWGTYSCTDGPLQNYCIATYKDCDRVYLYKYDHDFNGTSCTNQQYLRADILVPGTQTKGKVYASIPWGVPTGNTADSVLTFTATYS